MHLLAQVVTTEPEGLKLVRKWDWTWWRRYIKETDIRWSFIAFFQGKEENGESILNRVEDEVKSTVLTYEERYEDYLGRYDINVDCYWV